MNFTLWHRITAAVVFLISTVVFLLTVAPTISFWDCGEFITAAVTMGVPHPPGAPFFQLIGRMFSLLPFSDDLGFRVNLMSTFSSSLTVLFVYLTSIRLLRQWKGEPQSPMAALGMLISAATGALILSFSDTFWFNASEAEVYGIGMFFISAVVWIGLEWYFHIGVFNSERSLLLIAYLMGLSIGVHLLSLLALFFVFFLVYFRERNREDINARTLVLALAIMAAGFGVIYPGIVKYIPALLGSTGGLIFLFVILFALIATVAMKKLHPQLRMAALAILLVTLGYSTYVMVPIRASQQPALNENAPATLEGLYSFLNRDQYGSYPLLKGPNYSDRTRSVDFGKEVFLPRRWSPDAEHVQNYANYSSDLDYFLSYQFGHIYLRYFLWNFVGRAGDLQNAPVAFIGEVDDWSESSGYPNRYYAIPLILGLIGMYYHFRKDYRTGTAFAVLFFIMGIGLVLYFNMVNPQVRERDYFFVGSFFAFAIWTGIGVYGLIDLLLTRIGRNEAVGVALAVLMLVAGPVNMLAQNYRTHDRHYNYVAFDYAYNLLQSCDQDAILFTGGDNDTFPVWYLQYAAGIRRDVRVVNLSLLNTSWYSKQLKNERPYGAKTVAFSYSDTELDQMRPVQWEPQNLSIPVDPEGFNLGSLAELPYIKNLPRLPEKIDITVQSTYVDPAGTQGIRVQDILVMDILNNNFNTRPIYFALSTATTDRVSLDNYLVVEGLAQRVAPVALPQRGNRYYTNVNTAVTQRHLMDLRSVPDSNRAFGFMFRELNNPEINLDEASTKMIYSFRVAHMGLAQVMLQDEGNIEGATKVLAQMDKTIPAEYHEFDRSLRTDLTNMFLMLGDTTRYRAAADKLEADFLKEMESDPTGQRTGRSPVLFLLEYYDVTEQWDKGIGILQKVQQLYPDDPMVLERIREFQSYIDAGKRVTPAPDTTAASTMPQR
ncbi:MAG: DUF2723 domain-containing protein [Bacteroidota bacterium]|jgi:hypothetical protein|nr:DUF2723 domain-containing protein [Bacteroidota bacterium]